MVRIAPDRACFGLVQPEGDRGHATRRGAVMAIRPRIQRAFFAWLDEAQPRLQRKISVKRRTDRQIEFAFEPGTEILRDMGESW